MTMMMLERGIKEEILVICDQATAFQSAKYCLHLSSSVEDEDGVISFG